MKKKLITFAQARVLAKAEAANRVFVAGGFSGRATKAVETSSAFDSRKLIDALVDAGLLWFNEAANEHHLPDKGARKLSWFRGHSNDAPRLADALGRAPVAVAVPMPW